MNEPQTPGREQEIWARAAEVEQPTRSFGARLLYALTHSGPGYEVGATEVAGLRAELERRALMLQASRNQVAELEADRDAAVAAAVRRALEEAAHLLYLSTPYTDDSANVHLPAREQGCTWPTCLPEAEQQQLVADIGSEMHGGSAPARKQGEEER